MLSEAVLDDSPLSQQAFTESQPAAVLWPTLTFDLPEKTIYPSGTNPELTLCLQLETTML